MAFLCGTWVGEGEGDYPTIEGFAYRETVRIIPLPKPLLAYEQRTADAATGAPLHAESGWLRLAGGQPEMTVSQPTGIVECHTGVLEGRRLSLTSTAVALTPFASHHAVTAVRRLLEVQDDRLRYELWMAARAQPLQLHLRAELRRQGP